MTTLTTSCAAVPDASSECLTIPTGPVVHGVLRAIYGGAWEPDAYGRPEFRYEFRDGTISLFFESAADDTVVVSAASAAVTGGLSVETGDVFLILMSRLADLSDPRRDTAIIRLNEIAEYRGVRIRHGSGPLLRDRFRRDILRLASLRLTMSWRDYRRGGRLTFGADRPDRLFDIVDIAYTRDGETMTAFMYRCGQAMAHFLSPEAIRWVGRYGRAPLRLDPYHHALAKKIGTYWLLIAAITARKGRVPRATPRSVLEFCSEPPDLRAPHRTVGRFTEAHHQLQEISVLEAIPILEPVARTRGYFREWLDAPIAVRLSPALQPPAVEKGRLPVVTSDTSGSRGDTGIVAPKTPQALQTDPNLIKRLRAAHNLPQAELARAAGVRRETLSRYETGKARVPDALAEDLWALLGGG